jgi:hypothetical protein
MSVQLSITLTHFCKTAVRALGVTRITVTVIDSNSAIPTMTPTTMQGIFQMRLFLLTTCFSLFLIPSAYIINATVSYTLAVGY